MAKLFPSTAGSPATYQLGAVHGVSGRVVVIAGATSASGIAAATKLSTAGAQVVAVASSQERLDWMAERVPGVKTYLCDLTDASAVTALAGVIRSDIGPVDGLIQLVGGWSGGGGLAGQTDEDWTWLRGRIVTTLRNITRTWYDDLVASGAGRLAIVSATGASAPTASTANSPPSRRQPKPGPWRWQTGSIKRSRQTRRRLPGNVRQPSFCW